MAELTASGFRAFPAGRDLRVGSPDIAAGAEARDLFAHAGQQPSNVHVARYIPQSQILPRCDLLVTHGGHNTILAAINAGLPLVVVPLFSDQPDNARRCSELGLGRVIAPPNLNPEAVRDAVRAVIMEPSYRDNVYHLRVEMRALPRPDHGVRLLEQLVSARTPLHAAS